MQRQHDSVILFTSSTIVLLRSMDASDNWRSLLQLNTARTGADHCHLDLTWVGRPLLFLKFFCLGLRPRHLAPLRSPVARGEEDVLLTSPRTQRRVGVELTTLQGGGGGGSETGSCFVVDVFGG